MMNRSMISRDQIKARRLRWPRKGGFRSPAMLLSRLRNAASPGLSGALSGVLVFALISILFGVPGCAGGTPDVDVANRATQSASAHFDRPPLYRVDGGAGADLIMLGTIHLGPEKGWSLSPEVAVALKQASALVLELDLRQISEEALSTMVANMIMLEPPASLESVIRPKTAKLLEEMNSTVTAMGMTRSVRRHMKPWFVAANLIESTTTSSGYLASQSVEDILMAELGDRPLIPLETLEGQLRIFDDLSNDLQDVMLYDTLLRLDEAAEGIEELIQAWRTADERALERIALEGIDELPELELFYSHLLDKRNRTWLTQLIPLLEDSQRRDETILVGVGALHLVGPESVLSLMRKAGYAVSRIPQTKVKP